jgi:NitT/TauT family transport system permease protein
MWKWGLRAISVGLVIMIWEVFGHARNSLLLPTFSETLAAFGDLIRDPAFWRALGVSNAALVIGFSGAVVVGVPLGLWVGYKEWAHQLVSIYLSILLVTPMAAVIPLLIMTLGFTLAARAVVVFVFAVPFLVINTRTGLRHLPPNLLEMARSFGATEVSIWLKVLLPGALPGVFSGLRIGLGRAFTGMLLAELLLSADGVGHLLLIYQGNFEAGLIIVVVLESLALMRLLKLLDRRWTGWVGS